MKNRYRILELANIFNISKQTLIFYHKKGILIPNYIDENNGYRYYSNSQIWDLFMILILKEAGFSLEEIKKYAKPKSLEENIDFLEEKIEDIDKKIEELESSKNKIKDKLVTLKNLSENIEEKIKIKTIKKFKGYFIKINNSLDDVEIAGNYEKLKKIATKNGIKDVIYISVVNLEKYKGEKITPVDQLGIIIPENISIEGEQWIEEKKYVSLTHKTVYNTLYLTYINIFNYTKKAGYDIIGDSLEIGSEVVIPMENGVGGVLEINIPVKKRKKGR